MADIFHFKDISVVNGDVKVNVNLSRFSKQFQEAQFALDSQIMHDMEPLMPRVTGTFIGITRARSAALAGSGVVYAAAPPYGQFLYEGKVMIDPETGSPWARPGAKKEITERPLTYSNPQAVPHWFDRAKELHGKEWVEIVKEKAGGG